MNTLCCREYVQTMSMVNEYIVFFAKLLLMQSFMTGLAISSTNLTDQSALLAFRDHVFDPNNTLTNNWTITTSFCNWIGVSCSLRRQRVTTLNLSYMNLQGTINPIIYNLSFLVSLDLRNNSFHGYLPNEVGNLRRLRNIDFGNNNFNGTIPSSLGNISTLEVLNLENNKFQGTIPMEMSNLLNLQMLIIRNNELMGSIPSTIFNISSLRIMEFSDNRFSGNLPTGMGYHLPKLEGLYLSNNQLGGQIPSSLSICGELRTISVADNEFNGRIPSEIGNLTRLQILRLTGNHITGMIPNSLGNISSLEIITMGRNNISGDIPEELGKLKNLRLLNIELSNLTGAIPHSIFNISSLQAISLAFNRLEGEIPANMGNWLPNLEVLFLSNNRLSGKIPVSISNSSLLTMLDFGSNLFTGSIPTSLGNLQLLQSLLLVGNQLTNEPANAEFHFLTSLTECRHLKYLVIAFNPLNGFLPNSIGNLSTSLQVFVASGCQIKGSIPIEIGNLSGLTWFGLAVNNLSGAIPSTIGELQMLQRFSLDRNELQGSIPSELCSLTQLGELAFHENKLMGSIPNCIGNLRRLQKLFLHSNELSSPIPLGLLSLQNLLILNLSHNSLSGPLPVEMEKLSVMEEMDLSRNQLSGNIPSSIGEIESLRFLSLSWNSFDGPIPISFGKLISLESMDLSYNNLSGSIPNSMEELLHLVHLNLSFNRLQGEIPKRGAFVNLTIQSVMGNEALCGSSELQLPACPKNSATKSRPKALRVMYIFLIIIVPIVVIFTILTLWLRYRVRKRRVLVPADQLSPMTTHRMISYQELLQATDNFSEANLLGFGGFSSVYKGILSNGTTTAVKVLNLQLEGAFKSFDAECEVLRNVRHRNLVTVISSCSNLQFRALVLQYMPNGSLEKSLYSHNYCLSLLQRINISMDVAFALEYLHHGYSEPVVHCDLKPSNVLLDEDMIAHVADFGIAKILAENQSTTQTKTLGTIGYIAPEYGSEGRVSTSSDVYSYGIMLLEILTRKKPSDEMFVGDMSLRKWVNAVFPNAVNEVVDANLLRGDDLTTQTQQRCLSSIMGLALECSMESPEERINMKDVVVRLSKIKSEFVSTAGSASGKNP